MSLQAYFRCVLNYLMIPSMRSPLMYVYRSCTCADSQWLFCWRSWRCRTSMSNHFLLIMQVLFHAVHRIWFSRIPNPNYHDNPSIRAKCIFSLWLEGRLTWVTKSLLHSTIANVSEREICQGEGLIVHSCAGKLDLLVQCELKCAKLTLRQHNMARLRTK